MSPTGLWRSVHEVLRPPTAVFAAYKNIHVLKGIDTLLSSRECQDRVCADTCRVRQCAAASKTRDGHAIGGDLRPLEEDAIRRDLNRAGAHYRSGTSGDRHSIFGDQFAQRVGVAVTLATMARVIRTAGFICPPQSTHRRA